jgi:hypothetical protein
MIEGNITNSNTLSIILQIDSYTYYITICISRDKHPKKLLPGYECILQCSDKRKYCKQINIKTTTAWYDKWNKTRLFLSHKYIAIRSYGRNATKKNKTKYYVYFGCLSIY